MRRSLVNVIVGSPLCPSRGRIALLRHYGLDAQPARIDARCFFGGTDIVLAPGSILGARCILDNTSKVVIGRNTVLSPRVMIMTTTHDIGPPARRSGRRRTAPVTVGADCRIGAGTTILCGVEIGDGCVVRSGSLVIKSLPAHGEYAGVPALLVRDLRPGPNPSEREAVAVVGHG